MDKEKEEELANVKAHATNRTLNWAKSIKNKDMNLNIKKSTFVQSKIYETK